MDFDPEIRNIQIVSLAGGGFMGLFTAEFLARLEADGVDFLGTTDVFAGTSAGSLIALGLAAGVPAKTIAAKMREKGEAIFPPKIAKANAIVSAIQHPKTAKYETTGLKEALHDLVKTTKMGDLPRRALVPAVDMTAGTYRIFRGGVDGPDANILVADVALASAAAPLYFPVHAIGSNLFADGGLIANAPDAIAATEALHVLSGRAGRVKLLSVGTTLGAAGLAGSAIPNDWGPAQWASRLLDYSMAGQVALSRHMAETLLGADKVVTIDPLRSAEQNEVLALDKANAEAVNTLNAMADRAALNLTQSNRQFVNLWKAHQAVSYWTPA